VQRIPSLPTDSVPEASQPLIESIKAKFGRVPAVFATLAHSPAALRALTAMFEALEGGSLAGKPHEAIALRISELNGCAYCKAAHTGNARVAGATVAETVEWRKGGAADPRIKALLDLAASIAEKRGAVRDDELADARAAGLSDGEILETVAIVVCTVFTNSINNLAQTEVDFPAAPPLE